MSRDGVPGLRDFGNLARLENYAPGGVAGVFCDVRIRRDFRLSSEESMRNLPTALALLAVLACGACETGSDDTPVDPFIGKWSCFETRTLTFTTPAGSQSASGKSQFFVYANVADGQL